MKNGLIKKKDVEETLVNSSRATFLLKPPLLLTPPPTYCIVNYSIKFCCNELYLHVCAFKEKNSSRIRLRYRLHGPLQALQYYSRIILQLLHFSEEQIPDNKVLFLKYVACFRLQLQHGSQHITVNLGYFRCVYHFFTVLMK